MYCLIHIKRKGSFSSAVTCLNVLINEMLLSCCCGVVLNLFSLLSTKIFLEICLVKFFIFYFLNYFCSLQVVLVMILDLKVGQNLKCGGVVVSGQFYCVLFQASCNWSLLCLLWSMQQKLSLKQCPVALKLISKCESSHEMIVSILPKIEKISSPKITVAPNKRRTWTCVSSEEATKMARGLEHCSCEE